MKENIERRIKKEERKLSKKLEYWNKTVLVKKEERGYYTNDKEKKRKDREKKKEELWKEYI